MLVGLTALSVFAVIRFKNEPADLSATGPHTNQDKLPQLLFLGFVFLFIAMLFVDAIQYDYLTGLFPIFATCLTTVFLLPLCFQIVTSSGPCTAFFDSERIAGTSGSLLKSNEHYIFWLFGMLVFSALVGFVIGIAAFIFLFLLLKARISVVRSGLGALAFVLFLGVLSDRLTLQYPSGLMQDVAGVDLPWPLQ